MKRSLNLMSERSQKRNALRNCIRLWSRAFVVTTLFLTIVGVAKWRACAHVHAKQLSAENEYEPIRQLKLENGRIRKQIKSLRDTEKVSLELANHQPLLGLIGLAARAVGAQEGKLFLLHLEMEREPLPLDTDDASTLEVTFEGVTVDSGAVTSLADSLRELGPFATVELSSNATTHEGKQANQMFTIQCAN